MAFDLDAVGGYGSGGLGDATISSATTFDNYAVGFPILSAQRTVVGGDFEPQIAEVWRLKRGDKTRAWKSILLIQIGRREPDYDELDFSQRAPYEFDRYHAIIRYGDVGDGELYGNYHYTAEPPYGIDDYPTEIQTDAGVGKWEVRNIAYVGNDEWILDSPPTLDTVNYQIMGVYFNEYNNLTLNAGGSLTPVKFSFTVDDSTASASAALTGCKGGVIAIKVKDTLTFNGGHIDLTQKGANYTFRPYRLWRPQEFDGVWDYDLYAGYENSEAKDYLPINVGIGDVVFLGQRVEKIADGVAFILAKKIVTSNADSRIGNPAKTGVQYCRVERGKQHSSGGSNMFIATDNWISFNASIIAKYSDCEDYGRGVPRAYIASRNLHAGMLPDEGLYALDTFSVKDRLTAYCNINSFGDGQDAHITFGNNTVFSSYARVNSFADKTFNITKTITGKVDFDVGKLVMVHQLQKTSGQDVNSGNFYLAKILSISGDNVTLDTAPPFDLNTSNYYVQILTVPQLGNLTMGEGINHVGTPAWDNGVGGIFAITCRGTFTLNGKINLEGKGTKTSVTNKLVGNHFMRSKLYIGQGHGTAFIMARTLTLGENARIGGSYSGSETSGGCFGGTTWWEGSSGNEFHKGLPGGYKGSPPGSSGWGGGPGQTYYIDPKEKNFGGWFGNAPNFANATHDKTLGLQGAHLLIIANTINNFKLSAISTGGSGGDIYKSYSPENNYTFDWSGIDAYECESVPIEDYWASGSPYAGGHGGAGYGGGGHNSGGGYRGGGAGHEVYYSERYRKYVGSCNFIGGGGAGAAFIYCRKFTNQDTTGIVHP